MKYTISALTLLCNISVICREVLTILKPSLPRGLIKLVRCPMSVRCKQYQKPTAPRPLGRCQWHLACIFHGSWEKLPGSAISNYDPVLRGGIPNLSQSISAIPYTALCSRRYVAGELHCYAGFYVAKIPVKFPASHRRKQFDRERWPSRMADYLGCTFQAQPKNTSWITVPRISNHKVLPTFNN